MPLLSSLVLFMLLFQVTLLSYSSLFPHPRPSCPTRRSSDLHLQAALQPRVLRTGIFLAAPGLTAGRPEMTALSAGRLPRDRKSTRLNSSHLVISYAVFCLTKKTTIVVCTLIVRNCKLLTAPW